MSKAIIGKQYLAEMTESRTAESAPVWTDEPLDATRDAADPETTSFQELAGDLHHGLISRRIGLPDEQSDLKRAAIKHRLGLPDGFVSRLGRYGRSVLLQDNVYRLTTGQEFIPQQPSGTLGCRSHDYALLTLEQYEHGNRGTVFVKTDGRIFDYGFDHRDPNREIFDTGFTIQDLARTGRYAPLQKLRARVESERKKKRRGVPKRK